MILKVAVAVVTAIAGCAGRKCDDPVMRSDNDF